MCFEPLLFLIFPCEDIFIRFLLFTSLIPYSSTECPIFPYSSTKCINSLYSFMECIFYYILFWKYNLFKFFQKIYKISIFFYWLLKFDSFHPIISSSSSSLKLYIPYFSIKCFINPCVSIECIIIAYSSI